MNKTLFALAFCVVMCIDTYAQTKEDRNRNITAANRTQLQSFQKTLQSRHVASEIRVKDYLKKNPLLKRSFVKDGSLYYLERIDEDGYLVYINTKSNVESGALIKADQLYTGGSIGVNITGQNMVAGVWDGGQVRATHELLAGKVAMQPDQPLDGTADNHAGNNHQTHVTGTMVGKDIANQRSARGIAYEATAQNYDWSDDKTEMAAFAANGFLISNHSYGYSNGQGDPIWRFGAYDSNAREWDIIAKNAPFYLPFVAVGNEQRSSGNNTKVGYDIITGSSAAKNVMTVGALDADKAMSDYSNWGPTDDGRVKPEIVARGTGINSSTFANPNTNMPSDNSYSGDGAGSSGTSYSSPAAAAAGLLLQQYYKSLYGNYMKSSTLKALMLGTAEDLGQPGPDHKFGWGLLNVEKAAKAIKTKSISGSTTAQDYTEPLANTKGSYIEEITFNLPNNGTSEMIRRVYARGGEPLIISMAWTDDEGTEQASTDGIDPTVSRLVHEYDMLVRIINPANDVRPWQPSSMANRTADATVQTNWFQTNNNNYKQVIIPNPIAGAQYIIYFRKSTTSPNTLMPLSLIVTGTALAAPLASVQTRCTGQTVANLVATGTAIKWYNVATGGMALVTTTPLATGNYYATQTVDGIESLRTGAISVTVSNTTTTPSVSISPTVVCAGSTQAITTTPTNGGSSPTYLWKKNNVNLAMTQNITITNAVANDVYLLTITPSTDACPSPATATISLMIGVGCPSTITSIATGNWENTATWNLNRLPTAVDNVVIEANHIITVTGNDANAKKVETKANAKVIFNDNTTKLKLGF